MHNQNVTCSRKRHFFRNVLILALAGFCSGYAEERAAPDQMKGPRRKTTPSHFEKYGTVTNDLLVFYQKTISPVKGGNTCPMHPSCSQYAGIAFQMYPWYSAYVQTCERLLRCGHELSLYPVREISGQLKWYDPVPGRTSGIESENEDH